MSPTSPSSSASVLHSEWSDRLVLDGVSEKAMELLKDGGKVFTLPQELGGVQMSSREIFNAIMRISYPENSQRDFQIAQEEFQWKTVYRVSLPAFRVDAYMLMDSIGDTPEDAVSQWVENFIDVLDQHQKAGDLSAKDSFWVGSNSVRFNPNTKSFERV